MLQQLGACKFLLIAVLLEVVQKVFWEVNEAELGKFRDQIPHLLQAVVISELAQALEADLTQTLEAIRELDLGLDHLAVHLDEARQRHLRFAERV